jgi:hypothetical protein
MRSGRCRRRCSSPSRAGCCRCWRAGRSSGCEGREVVALGVSRCHRLVGRWPPITAGRRSCCARSRGDRRVVLGAGRAARAQLCAAQRRPALDAAQSRSSIWSSIRPGKPPRTPSMAWPREMPRRTAARTAVFMPGARPPACRIAIRAPAPGTSARGWAIQRRRRASWR